jgi:hypothetical protein
MVAIASELPAISDVMSLVEARRPLDVLKSAVMAMWDDGRRRAICIHPRPRRSRGSDPRLLRLTMDRLLDRIFGERPLASRLVLVPG